MLRHCWGNFVSWNAIAAKIGIWNNDNKAFIGIDVCKAVDWIDGGFLSVRPALAQRSKEKNSPADSSASTVWSPLMQNCVCAMICCKIRRRSALVFGFPSSPKEIRPMEGPSPECPTNCISAEMQVVCRCQYSWKKACSVTSIIQMWDVPHSLYFRFHETPPLSRHKALVADQVVRLSR